MERWQVGRCSASKGHMTLFMEPPGSMGLSSRWAIPYPFPAGRTPKRGDVVSCPAWGCTIDKFMWIEKGKEERGRGGGGEKANSTWLGMKS